MTEKSEKLLKLEKRVHVALGGTIHPEDLGGLLEYIESVLVKELPEVLEELRLSIEKLHEPEPRKPLTFGEKVRLNIHKNSEEKINPYYRKKFTAIHYTSVNALVSMLGNTAAKEQDCLRMYDSVHLNDPDEGNYIAHMLRIGHDWFEKKESSHAYIVSFAAPEKDMVDNLMYWRTYGKNGEGCSLALSVPPDLLKKVLYGRDAHITLTIMRDVLDFLDLVMDKVPRRLRKSIGKTLSEIVWKFLEEFRYLYKSAAHDHEKEYRIVLPEEAIEDKDKILFEPQEGDNGPARVRHYYMNRRLAIEKLFDDNSFVTLGPCVNNSYNMSYYLRNLMRKAGVPGSEIVSSMIPYRNI